MFICGAVTYFENGLLCKTLGVNSRFKEKVFWTFQVIWKIYGVYRTYFRNQPTQPSGCDPELTGLAGTPSLCSLQSLSAKG